MRIVRALLSVCLLAAPFSALRAQDVDAAGTPPAPNGYVPQQYTPLYSPVTGQAPAPGASGVFNEPGAPAADEVAPPRQPEPDNQSLPSFRAPIAMPRMDAGTAGFAPVVSAPTPVHARNLVDENTGLPRVYAPGFRLGPFDVRPDLGVAGTYNDNIFLAPAGAPRIVDYIVTIAPVLSLSFQNGDDATPDSTEFTLDYIPDFLEFTQNPQNSTLNQSVNAELGHRFSKLRLFGGLSYNHISGGVIESGDLVNHDDYVASFDASYALTPKLGTEWSIAYTADRFSKGFGSDDVHTAFYFNYELRPKLTLSLAPYFDYTTSQGSSNKQYAAGGIARADYNYSDRTSFYLQVGAGDRENSISSLTIPEWNFVGGLQWQAGPKTTFSASGTRTTKASVISVNSDFSDTSLTVSVNQALPAHLTGTLSGSYDHAEYFSILDNTRQQTYDYFSIGPGLSYRPSIWSEVGMTYTYRQNFSNIPTSEFYNNQITLYSTVRF